jgi:hypothetical protein
VIAGGVAGATGGAGAGGLGRHADAVTSAASPAHATRRNDRARLPPGAVLTVPPAVPGTAA